MRVEMSDYAKQKPGCGIQVLYNGVFCRKGVQPRRTVSTSSIPIDKFTNIITGLKLKRVGSEDTTLILNRRRNSIGFPAKPAIQRQRGSSSGNTTTSTSSPSSTSSDKVTKATSAPGPVRRRSSSRAGSIISEEQGSAVRSRVLVRASSAKIIHPSNLGKQTDIPSDNNTIIGNLMKKDKDLNSGFLCKTLSNTVSSDKLKLIGNEEYKKGRFSEALALYDGAIALNNDHAPYRYNKSAAFLGLGRLLEAVFECREAIRLDHTYQRAHHRLATLYMRLGEGGRALYHFKQSGEAKSSEISKAQILQAHIINCSEAKRLLAWNRLLKETEMAISLGADLAPELFSLQAEALLKLRRHQDADSALKKRPHFDVDACTKFFGPTKNARFLLIQAQVDIAAGRFDAAVVAAQQALRLDSSDKEVSFVVKMIGAVSSARTDGNNLFKASKFSKAITTYTEGLEHDPLNSVLLCNRAACRIKLGHFEKAMEDCTIALNVRPCYTKARLRRAECNAKMERWMASIQDYEILIREHPTDEELGRALLAAQAQLKEQRSQYQAMAADVNSISNQECFPQLIAPPVQCVHVGG